MFNRWLVCLLLCAPFACAQTNTPVTLSFELALSGDVATSGSGSVDPFGPAYISLSSTTYSILFYTGDSFDMHITSLGIDGNVSNATATLVNGTGIFAKATGSFSLTLTGETLAVGVILNGSGSISLPAGVAGPGGSGYPVSGPGGSGYPVSGPGGSGYPFEACLKGGPSASSSRKGGLSIATETCTVAQSGNTTTYTIYDLNDPNVATQVQILNNGNGTSAIENVQVITNQMVLSIMQNQANNSRPKASPASVRATLEIVIPRQNAATSYAASASSPDCVGAQACWIGVSASGQIAAGGRAAIPVSIDASALAPGIHQGRVVVVLPSSTLDYPVTAVVSRASPAMALSQTGVQFRAPSGSTTAQGQSIAISNQGSGLLPFSATVSTLNGGNWLSVSSASGTAPAHVTVQADPSALAPGVYSGRVDFASAGALNAPQSVAVLLTVESPTSAAPLVVPSSLNFVGSNPAPKTVQLFNPSTGTLNATVKLAFQQGSNWFTANPASGTVTAGEALAVEVTVNASGLAPGFYQGSVDILLAGRGADYLVPVTLLVPKTVSCTPTQLIPVFTNIEGGFSAQAGAAVPIQASVSDDCGSPVSSGFVAAYFPGSTDTEAVMTSNGDGQWTGTWMPHNLSGGAAAVGLVAASGALSGSSGISGTLVADSSVPMISPGAAVSAASLALGSPLAPGGFVSIFGSNLASGSNLAAGYPYPAKLGGTQVLLGGEPLALEYVGPGQINAVVPYDAPINSTQQLWVTQNGVESMPETVLIGAAQPSVFTQNQSGAGAGAVLVIQASGAEFLNTPSAPAGAGDVLAIYCTGLGAVAPPVPAGSAAPLSTLSYTVNPVTLTIGGVSAQVLFAGLAPGFAGLYQVNAIVPQGVTPGPAVPVIVSESGASSPAVTVAIH